MTRPADDVRRVADMLDQGLSQAEVARRTGIPRPTVREWAAIGITNVLARRTRLHSADQSVSCRWVLEAPAAPYAYLLGLYLGDGCLSLHRAGVYRLRIALDERYPSIIDECEVAMAQILPNTVGRVAGQGCVSVNAYSRHWPCLFPQHAAGRKHLRPIRLEAWQDRIALDEEPRMLLRGLVHSDGYRGTNRIKGRYAYPRYVFSNRSGDIRRIFADACGRVGVCTTQCGQWQLSVARKKDVELFDTFIGPKL